MVLQGKFDMDSKDGTAIDVCTDIFQSGIRQQRYRLKAQYWKKIENMTEEQAFLEKPKNVDENSWKKLVRKWFDQHYQVHVSYLCAYIFYICKKGLGNTKLTHEQTGNV